MARSPRARIFAWARLTAFCRRDSWAWNRLEPRPGLRGAPSSSADKATKPSTMELLSVQAVQRLDIQMVPVLEAKARPQVLRGDFKAAAFMAMKEVEVRVRELAGLSNSVIGKTLMTDAFRPPKMRMIRTITEGRSGTQPQTPGKPLPSWSCSRAPSGPSRTPRAIAASTSQTPPRPRKPSSPICSYASPRQDRRSTERSHVALRFRIPSPGALHLT